MGLFSKKKRISTATQTLSLVEDTPDVIKQSVIGSLVNNSDLSTDIMNTMLGLFKGKVNNYYRYGRDHYTNGLPEGFMGGLAVSYTTLQPILESITPPPIDHKLIIDSGVLDQAYYEGFMGEEWLRNNTDWNPVTNELSANNPVLPGVKVTYKPGLTTLSADKTKVVLRFLPTGSAKVDPPSYIKLEALPKYKYSINDYFYYVKYLIVNKEGKQVGYTYYWSYKENTGLYPSLDIGSPAELTNQYMPIVPLRVEYTSYTNPSLAGTPLYDTSKKLLKKIELKMSQLDEGVNANPDIKEIAHAYVVLGIDVKQDTPEINEYLFRFFDDLQMKGKYTEDSWNYWSALPVEERGTPPMNIMSIRDGTYNTELNYYYISKRMIAGSFGKIGRYRKSTKGGFGMIEGINYDYEDPKNSIVIDYQITANLYQRVTVVGICQTVAMYNAKNHVISLTSDENEVILVPVNNDLISKMKPLVANTVAYHSLKVVFHAYKVTYVKWYQTGFFKFVTVVIAVAVSIFTGGAGSFIASLTAAAAAGVVALGAFVAQTIAITLATQVAFKFVAQHLGTEFASLLALVALTYGLLGSDMAFELPYADSILATTGPMYNAIGEVTADKFTSLYNDYSEFMEEYSGREDELSAMWKELQPSNRLDPLGIYTSIDMPAYESPNQYIARKTTTNIADLVGYTAVQNFVDNQLNLDV